MEKKNQTQVLGFGNFYIKKIISNSTINMKTTKSCTFISRRWFLFTFTHRSMKHHQKRIHYFPIRTMWKRNARRNTNVHHNIHFMNTQMLCKKPKVDTIWMVYIYSWIWYKVHQSLDHFESKRWKDIKNLKCIMEILWKHNIFDIKWSFVSSFTTLVFCVTKFCLDLFHHPQISAWITFWLFGSLIRYSIGKSKWPFQ